MGEVIRILAQIIRAVIKEFVRVIVWVWRRWKIE